MKIPDIDWEAEEIRLIQKKTGNELILPLAAVTGNAIYDYVNNERPESDNAQIFLSEIVPHNPINPQTVGHVATKIYETAAIRQDISDSKGAHLFRHNLATSLMGQGIPRPVISSALGHVDPDSVDKYLFADIIHLRECSLSIENIPVSEEVFCI
jgi:integrase